ncbi:Nucleolar protein 56 [Quillaja saponaria]|uniref:Nucleolar protein 56 n=1 Tax=Quillaja saponaria TaxID=32244 RepID=A0AAD7KME9_QUISA|nr:Nucleolar protein 56 [Quillaja saponaria]
MARYLANKCSIASQIDCFADKGSTVFGEKLREQVEERLDFYDKGVAPRKNLDVMKAAIETAVNKEMETNEVPSEASVKKSKKKKSKSVADADDSNAMAEDTPTTATNGGASEDDNPEKKKKERKAEILDQGMEQQDQVTDDVNGFDAEQNGTAKKKKRKDKYEDGDFQAASDIKKTKKKSKSKDSE